MRTIRCRTTPPGTSAVCVAAVAVCLAISGCGSRIDDTYGQRQGLGAGRSVNGTAVLGEMFEQSGHTVFSWNRLSPRLRQRADCIVWFPDDFSPPTNEVCSWLETWLEEEPGRTLIYVGRDFDAARWYWEKIGPEIPSKQRSAYVVHLNKAGSKFAAERSAISSRQNSPWFDVEHELSRRSVQTLSGDPDWLDGIDPDKLEIELNGRFLPADCTEVVLESEGDMLVARQWIGESQLIVVTNGSFLLNLPLVNHEHRKLAGKLIDTIGTEKHSVVFLESRAGGPPISEDDLASGMPSGIAIFNVWPTNWILLHLAVVGILFCFWRFPIFGVARSGEPARLSDFGKHLDAVAELLKQSGDAAYAGQRVKQYVEKVKSSD